MKAIFKDIIYHSEFPRNGNAVHHQFLVSVALSKPMKYGFKIPKPLKMAVMAIIRSLAATLRIKVF